MNKQQLANRIWIAANKMRSKIDANEYKDYILGLIFYKYLSDNEEKCWKEQLDIEEEDFVDIVYDETDRNMMTLVGECQKRIGYFIEYKYLFSTWLKSRNFNVATLNDALGSFSRLIITKYKSVYDGIFRSLEAGLPKLGENAVAQTKSLKELIHLIQDIPTDSRQDYDVLGFVYEFLISSFAATAGKKAGEFYTPHEVAMVMSEIVAEHHKDKPSLEVYDPTSGSGSLLITIGKAVSRHISGENKVKYYAQELKENTYNLTRMNLVMRGIIPQNIITRCADTLEDDWPIHEEGSDIDKPLAVDAVVSNPPYSLHWVNTNKENDPRFANYGLAPKTKADYAFLLHELHHLKADGILTIVLPHGVLFRGKAPKVYDAEGNLLPDDKREEGQAEGQIRANLIEKNNIDAIIGLPAGIFFGTEIPTIIMVLKKQKRTEDGVLIIDASKGFVKDGKQNKLRACDIRKIADAYRDRANIPGFSRVVSREEIRRNDYNLNIPRYVDSSESAEKFDIYSIMFGGIPNSEIDELSEYWQTFPSLRNEVFAEVDGKPYSTLRAGDVAAAILRNNDVAAYLNNYQQCFGTLRQVLYSRLVDHVETVKEMEAQDLISAHILARAERMPIIDKYHAYQILADKWQEIIGDIEIIQSEGVAACNVVEPKYKMAKDKDGLETEVPDGVKGRIFPFEMIQKVYFAKQLEALERLNNDLQSHDDELNTIFENLAEDEQDALLDDDKAKWNNNAIKKAMNEIIADLALKGSAAKKKEQFMQHSFEEESLEALVQKVVRIQEETKNLKKEVKDSNKALEKLTIEKIEALTMLEINQLLELKWISPIVSQIEALPHSMLQALSEKIVALNEKYATSFADIENEIKASSDALAELVGQLTGDEFAVKGLEALINKDAQE